MKLKQLFEEREEMLVVPAGKDSDFDVWWLGGNEFEVGEDGAVIARFVADVKNEEEAKIAGKKWIDVNYANYKNDTENDLPYKTKWT